MSPTFDPDNRPPARGELPPAPPQTAADAAAEFAHALADRLGRPQAYRRLEDPVLPCCLGENGQHAPACRFHNNPRP